MDFLNFMFSGLWRFIGCLVVLALFAGCVCILWSTLFRAVNMAIHGYPPPHCDGDGDPIIYEFKEESND